MKQYQQIAILGIGCRFPGGANNPKDFWVNLVHDKPRHESIEGYAGSLQEYSYQEFDNTFFDYGEQETELLDPQQRMLLEVTHETLENAAIAPGSLVNRSVGVYIGLCNSDFQSIQFWNKNPNDLSIYSGLGSAFCSASGRLSRFYNFHGPCMTIDTACSSSLVAIHQACLGLASEDCDLALAGGANAILSPHMTEYLFKLGVMASTKNSIAYNRLSDGYIRAEGCGMVALKRLDDAVRDHDRILAVIRGSSVNHDGSSSSFTAPNAEAQAALIQNTLDKCGLTPSSIDYVETHGTGTPLGDTAEIQALSKVFGECMHTKKKIASVKAKLGHLEAAAGVAGLIKTVLCIQHKTLPAHSGTMDLNPQMDWVSCPVQPVFKKTDWLSGSIRRAGVSSFGLTGTNAHVVLEEHIPENTAVEDAHDLPAHLFVLSAKSKSVLIDLVKRYLEFLPHTNHCMKDICFTAAVGRDQYSFRLATVIQKKEELQAFLQYFVNHGDASGNDKPVRIELLKQHQNHSVVFDTFWNMDVPKQDIIERILQSDCHRIEFSHTLFNFAGLLHYERALKIIAKLYLTGIDVDWQSMYPTDIYQKIELPIYPFQRIRIWNIETSDEQKLKKPSSNVSHIHPENPHQKTRNEKEIVRQTVVAILDKNGQALIEDKPLSEQGFDSISGQELRHALETKFEIKLPTSFYYNYPTIKSMAEGLKEF